jgi:RNA polymerase sigma-70 factor (ECF subfamily)
MVQRDEQGGSPRAMVYCLVPRDLAGRVHEGLRRFFADDSHVEVVVERRGADRRALGDRREDAGASAEAERRRIRNAAGRRIADRRATLAPSSVPELPRKLRAHAERLVFVERIEPTTEKLRDIDSARLVTRFQAGDKEAFSELYLRYFERVFSYLRVLFRDDPHEAEDLTQQVFTKVFEALPRYTRRTQPFRAWLFTIVRNEALQQLGKRGRSDLVDPSRLAARIETDEPELEETPVATLALDWITDRELLMFVERLSLPQRQVLLLRYMLDLSTREIGEILGRSTDDVRMLDSRARRFLEQRLVALGRVPHGRRSRMQWRRQIKLAPVIRQRRFALHR